MQAPGQRIAWEVQRPSDELWIVGDNHLDQFSTSGRNSKHSSRISMTAGSVNSISLLDYLFSLQYCWQLKKKFSIQAMVFPSRAGSSGSRAICFTPHPTGGHWVAAVFSIASRSFRVRMWYIKKRSETIQSFSYMHIKMRQNNSSLSFSFFFPAKYSTK